MTLAKLTVHVCNNGQPLLAIGILILLLLINLAGVEWVIRFQIILAIILAIAAFDFLIGPAIKRERQFGNQTLEVKFSEDYVSKNSYPNWRSLPSDAVPVLPVNVHEFFLIFGIFFPSITGRAQILLVELVFG